MRIDVHTHFLCLDFVKHMQGRAALPTTVLEDGIYFVNCGAGLNLPTIPKIVDMDEKLRDMEEMQVDISALSHGIPGPDTLGGAEADDWAARINDHLAGIIEQYPDKFIGFGNIGFGSTERSIAEVDRCINELGFKGLQIFSNTNNTVLDAPEFMPVYKHIASLGAPLNMHPAYPLNSIGIDKSTLVVPLGFLYDTSLNTVRLIQSGLFDEAPQFTLIVPHIGGVIPYLYGRLASYHSPTSHFKDQPDLQHPFGHYLDRLYIDTVCYHAAALQYCCDFMDVERILYGTDHPFGDYNLAADMVEQLDCSAADRELIYHGNAERLLKLT